MNAIRPYWMLVKREIWEHKSFWMVPIVVACISVLLNLYIAGSLIVAAHHGALSVSNLTITSGPDARTTLHVAMLAMFGFFNIVMLFTVWFYLMDSLYADRKDRSVLFWKSMPISDTTTVLTKLFTGMVTAPALMLIMVVITEIVVGIIFIIAAATVGINLLHLAFFPGTIILTWVVMAFALIQQSLWLLPYWGWFLLCSAWAKKVVLAWVVLIPLGAILIELVVFRTHFLSDAIIGHIGRGVKFIGGIMINGQHADLTVMHRGVFGPASGQVYSFGLVAHMFALPEMWIGIAVGAVFVFAAIWLRRNRSEI